MEENNLNEDNLKYEDQIEGRNSVLELLESGKDINKIYIAKGEKHGSINKIIAKAKENKVVIVEIEKEKLNKTNKTNKIPTTQTKITTIPETANNFFS